MTCCAASKVSERLAAYPLLRSFLRGRLVVLAPFPALFRSPASARLCTCLFMLRSSNRGLICCCWLIVAEADVRVRVRGRVVRVHRQRRQVRVVSVVTAEKTTNRPYSAAALFQPHHLTGTPIPLCVLVGGMDFCFNDVAPHLHTMRAKFRLGFTAKKRGHPHRWR